MISPVGQTLWGRLWTDVARLSLQEGHIDPMPTCWLWEKRSLCLARPGLISYFKGSKGRLSI